MGLGLGLGIGLGLGLELGLAGQLDLPSFSSVTPACCEVPTALRPSESCRPISSVCCAHSRRIPLVVISCCRPCSLRSGYMR